MSDIHPVLVRLPWFTLYGMPERPGRLARLRCVMAMLVHEVVELVAGTTVAHSMRSAFRFQIGAPAWTPPEGLPTDATDSTLMETIHSARHNADAAAINSIVTMLGSDPTQGEATLTAFLASLGPGAILIQGTAPDEPTNPAETVWWKSTQPTDAGLVAFIDFRNQPDGGVQAYTNDRGTGERLAVADIFDIVPAVASPLTIEDGVLRGEIDNDPARSIISLPVGVITGGWRIIMKLADVLDDGVELEIPNVTQTNITYTFTGGNGYILHAVIHDRTAVGATAGNGSFLAIGTDVAGVATITYAPPTVSYFPGYPEHRKMRGGDVVSLGWLGGDDFDGTLNGDVLCTMTDTTFDPETLTDISIPINRGPGGNTWRCGVEWIAVTTGEDFDPDHGLLHFWDADLPTPRWVPIQPYPDPNPVPAVTVPEVITAAPSVVVEAGAGTGASATVRADSTDDNGWIDLVTGTTPGGGLLFTVEISTGSLASGPPVFLVCTSNPAVTEIEKWTVTWTDATHFAVYANAVSVLDDSASYAVGYSMRPLLG